MREGSRVSNMLPRGHGWIDANANEKDVVQCFTVNIFNGHYMELS